MKKLYSYLFLCGFQKKIRFTERRYILSESEYTCVCTYKQKGIAVSTSIIEFLRFRKFDVFRVVHAPNIVLGC